MRFLAALLIFLAGLTYLRGWRRLQPPPGQEAPPRSLASNRSRALFFAGLLMLALVLISPLGHLSTQYFSARIIQHMLLVASVPSLIMLSNPVPALLQGLPDNWREWLMGVDRNPHSTQEAGFLRCFVFNATRPSVTLLAFLCVCWFWYDPAVHRATLTYTWVHAVEILSLLTVALLNWWHITAAWPQVHGVMPPVVRIGYTFVSVWPIKLVGLVLLFIGEPLYDYPATFQFSGLQINDASFGAMIAWIGSGTAYLTTVVMLIRAWLEEEDGKPALPEAAWATDEAMLAPGVRR